ncbi:mannonate dehydratase [Spirochaeta cellobiosiphila]|uniref:mannonate dehydratase n=1 Tax=Spirochaeta cellobiosiphila TaxID=504483 RepID=UPI00040881AD|nr:mannonate dehydratase [Spirochaeta cellobiosiphila]
MSALNEWGMEESMRWYGPLDKVSLNDIRQSGASAVITSLHHIPYGEAWPLEDIIVRKKLIEEAGLRWAAVESVPVHEDIKTRTGRYQEYIENYKISLINLGKAGIDTVIYNFMPVLDWVRTDISYKLADGSECLFYDPVHFAAFDMFILERPGADKDYTEDQIKRAKIFYDSLSSEEKKEFTQTIIDVFPGTKLGLSIDDIKNMLSKYANIDTDQLKAHYKSFLEEIIPVAARVGIRMAVHPDDPPWNIMGLPRIVSCSQDIEDLLAMVDDPSNGLCFCTGSYSPRSDNDLPRMIEQYGNRINCVHLRSTQRNSDGSFYEANHLEGSVDMYQVITQLLKEQARRKSEGRPDWRFTFRPDHGHTIIDDLKKEVPDNPGYTLIGRLKGLAEIRGLELGIIKGLWA